MTLTVPRKLSPVLIGKKGVRLRQWQDDFDVLLKFGEGDGEEVETLTITGTPQHCQQARTEILKVMAQEANIVTQIVSIPVEYHKALIGAGGRHIRDFVAEALARPGSSEVNVRFPREGDAEMDAVQVIGPAKEVHTVIKALKEHVAKKEVFLRFLLVFTLKLKAM